MSGYKRYRNFLFLLSMASVVGWSYFLGPNESERPTPQKKKTTVTPVSLSALPEPPKSEKKLNQSLAPKPALSNGLVTAELGSETEDGAWEEDEIDFDRVDFEEVAAEMEQVQQEWEKLRSDVYREMGLKPVEVAYLNQSRNHLQATLDYYEQVLEQTEEPKKIEIWKMIQQAQLRHDSYTKTILGPDRYDLIKRVRDQFNLDVQEKTNYLSRVSDTW